MQIDDSACDREKCVTYSKSFCSCLFSHIGLSGLVVAYTILGGFVFYQIEISTERLVKQEMINLRNLTEIKFLNLLNSELQTDSNFTDKLTSIRELLDEHERAMMESIFDKGWNGRYSINDTNWSYEGSILYSVTVITTIGYGHVTPKTNLGRIVTIFYALFGIPLAILYLNNIGDYLAQIFRLVYSQLCHPLCSNLLSRKKRAVHNNDIFKARVSVESSIQIKTSLHENVNDTNTDFESDSSRKMSHSFTEPLLSIEHAKISCWSDLETLQNKLEKSEETQILTSQVQLNKNENAHSYAEEIPNDSTHADNQNPSCHYVVVSETVPLTLTLLIMVVYIVMGAFLFTFWGNEQDYLKWSYFCFITLSTIGFGDIVPGTTVNDHNPKEKLIVSVLYVAIGLPVFAMCFKLMEDEIVNKVKILAKKIGIIKT